jgi:hypothetical protein
MPSPPFDEGPALGHGRVPKREYHAPELRPYHAPELSDLGSLAQVTQSAPSQGANVDATYTGGGANYAS